MNSKKNKAIGIASVILCVLFLILQLGYIFILKKHNFEYVIDELKYIINEIIIIFLFLSLILLKSENNKKVINNIMIIGIILGMIINTVFMCISGIENKSIVRFSRNLSTELVLKEDKESKKITIYKNVIFLFARPKDELDDIVNSEIKTKWMTNDVCSVTYKNSNNKICEYVFTKGDRGDGISYYYVSSVIQREWIYNNKKTEGKELSIDNGEIAIKTENGVENYSFSDCKQYGTLAIVLYKDEIPKWVIALNENCNINEKTDLLEKGSTISLYKVSMDKDEMYEFVCNNSENDLSLYNDNSNVDSTYEEGKKLADGMNELIEKDPTLSNFVSTQNEVKVITDSNDIFYVARLGIEENDKLFAINGCNSDVQINKIEMIAGNEEECLMEIYTTEVISSIDQNTNEISSSEKGNFEWQYRIKKGNGAYLVVKTTSLLDATVGLDKISEEKIIETSNNKDYHYFIKAEFNATT